MENKSLAMPVLAVDINLFNSQERLHDSSVALFHGHP